MTLVRQTGASAGCASRSKDPMNMEAALHNIPIHRSQNVPNLSRPFTLIRLSEGPFTAP